jgi:hypothetical protein
MRCPNCGLNNIANSDGESGPKELKLKWDCERREKPIAAFIPLGNQDERAEGTKDEGPTKWEKKSSRKRRMEGKRKENEDHRQECTS